jgi:hypothetical protein
MLERLDYVGHGVHGPKKAGKDSGEPVGAAPIGIKTTRDIDSGRSAEAPGVHEQMQNRVWRSTVTAIAKGTPAAKWFQLIGMVGGKERVMVEHVNWVHIDDVPDDWPAVHIAPYGVGPLCNAR